MEVGARGGGDNRHHLTLDLSNGSEVQRLVFGRLFIGVEAPEGSDGLRVHGRTWRYQRLSPDETARLDQLASLDKLREAASRYQQRAAQRGYAIKDRRQLFALLNEQQRFTSGVMAGDSPFVLEDSDILAGEVLFGRKFQKARLVRCDMTGINLIMTRLDGAVLTGCRIERASVEGVKWYDAHLSDCSFRGSAVGGGAWSKAVVERCDFQEAHLGEGKWEGATVSACNMRGVTLFCAMLSGARLRECDLRDALMMESRLKKTIFDRCDLRGADLSKAVLSGTVFDRCKLAGVKGTPELHIPCTLIEPDLSPDGDGSGVVSPSEAVRALGWR